MEEPLIPADPAARKRTVGGIMMLALGAVMGYFFVYQPVHEALRTGSLHYYVKGILLPPLCFYLAGILLFTEFKDGQLRTLNRKGKPTFTRKGWCVMAGAFAVMAVCLAGWFWYLHALGFHQS